MNNDLFLRCSLRCYNSDDRCRTNPNNLLVILFSIDYPRTCTLQACQTRYARMVKDRISAERDRIALSVILTNGESLNLPVSYCSLVDTSAGEHLIV